MLVREVVGDVIVYFSFIGLWVLIFALFYQALGIDSIVATNRGNGALLGYISGAWDISIQG